MILVGTMLAGNFTYSGLGRSEFRYIFEMSAVHILAPSVEIVLFTSILNVSSDATCVVTAPSYLSLPPPAVVLTLHFSSFSLV